MQIYTKEEAAAQQEHLIERIKKGAVFIYPTDTIYGIGCDATNTHSVQRIRAIKQRDTKPFSIIAPSKQWIKEHCTMTHDTLQKLPGPYTLLVGLSDDTVCSDVHPGIPTLGVRIPNHWISTLVAQLGRPLVTTSVNLSGQQNAKTLEELNTFSVDFIIYEGPLNGRPSTLIDTFNGKEHQR